MSVTYNKFNLTVETSNGEIATDAVTVNHLLNDIPTANISFIPRTTKEIALVNNIDNDLFETYTIRASINNKSEIIFEGQLSGSQTVDNVDQIQISLSLYGGLYKLSQLSTFLPGMHSFSSADMYLSRKFSTKNGPLYFTNIAKFVKNGNSLIDVFKNVSLTLLQEVIKISDQIGSPNSVSFPYGSVSTLTKDLIKTIGNQYKDTIESEYNKLLVPTSITSDSIKLFSESVVKSMLLNFASSPDSTYWNYLVRLCEQYQLCIGTYADATFIAPFFPVSNPLINISSSDVSTVSISPLPLKIPTRCFYSAASALGTAVSYYGSFPSGQKATQLTALEKKLGTIRTLVYNKVGPSYFIKQNPSKLITALKTQNKSTTNTLSQDVKNFEKQLDKFAQAYLIKETFKHRTGTLNLRYYTKIPTGVVISFSDPFYNKKYRGFVTQVIHTLTGTSVQTTVMLQYVMSESEITALGLKNDGYLESILYESYNPSNLISLLKL